MDSLVTEMVAAGVYLSILVLMVAFVWCLWLFCYRLVARLDQSWLANYRKAAVLYPLRDKVRGWGGWTRAYIRDEPGGPLWDMRIRPMGDGLLIRHLYEIRARPRLLIPVTAFSNPHKLDLPWREFLLNDRIVELQVEQVAMSVLVPETMWREYLHEGSDSNG